MASRSPLHPDDGLQPLTIYFDGRCPLCLAEIHMLSARNRSGLLGFEDVSAEGYDEAVHGVSCELALAQIHGRLADGQTLTGVAVFAAAYRRAGLAPMAWLLSIGWLAPAWAAAYGFFARHRHAISRLAGPLLLRMARWRYPSTSNRTSH
jgi:predicted DCC family thiol-disulfide oxidoreductase YuxK